VGTDMERGMEGESVIGFKEGEFVIGDNEGETVRLSVGRELKLRDGGKEGELVKL
jgi:hypothetical protein